MVWRGKGVVMKFRKKTTTERVREWTTRTKKGRPQIPDEILWRSPLFQKTVRCVHGLTKEVDRLAKNQLETRDRKSTHEQQDDNQHQR